MNRETVVLSGEDAVVLLRAEFRDLLRQAAHDGAREALAAVGLHDDDAAADLRDLRGILDAYRMARRTIWQTAIKVATAAVLAALIAGLAVTWKLDLTP
jgi:hypothetical protein